ncbi:LOW QUALITY PROTEIN: embigin [Rhinatrema bivittatum]|uniref:LOW QUALITY PROTEIN: embigin n=1 Tax=Rhinatrema bivittatum TaxID=194408 RepID=UPI00112742FA|nr:LOW QUALITY PROTEIN: embigin [Rhinatrema bivittatum]
MCPWRSTPLLLLLLALAAPGRADTEGKADAYMAEQNVDKENSRIVSNQTVMVQSISIPELSVALEKTVVIDRPTIMELSCELPSDLGSLPAIEVFWTHHDEEINGSRSTFNKTGNPWHTLYRFHINDSSHMGNYCCIFKADKEVKAIFHLKVPKVKGADKPMVTYERDTVVMKCDSSKYDPVEWIWYRMNESGQVAVNESVMPSKYEVTRKRVNETKLHIMDLSADDSGLYRCVAIFKVGQVKSEIQLNVLSYMAPLKPFIAIVRRVVVLVAIILICEMQTTKEAGKGR